MKITWMQPYYDIILSHVPIGTKSLIDVGSGYGIFGYILSKARDITKLVSVEPFDYDTPQYTESIKSTWQKFYNTSPDRVDVIVSTEMIEHLTKEDAILFLKQAKCLADRVVIATPYKYEDQEKYDGNEYQVHRCVISTADFYNEGYDVRYMSTLNIRGLTARIHYHPKWQRYIKLIGIAPTNIIGVYK